jgi:Tat protein translocase TatB subunit
LEFLGIGYQELLLILALLLVVVGPERLPGMAYQIGRAVRQMQRYARAVRDEFSDEFDYLETQYRTVRGEVDSARGSFRGEQAKFQAELRESAPSLTEPLLPPVEKPSAPLTTFQPQTNGQTPEAATETAAAPEPVADKPPLVF